MSSRLFQKIREDGDAYTVFSYPHLSNWVFHLCRFKPDNLKSVTKLIMEESRLKDGYDDRLYDSALRSFILGLGEHKQG